MNIEMNNQSVMVEDKYCKKCKKVTHHVMGYCEHENV